MRERLVALMLLLPAGICAQETDGALPDEAASVRFKYEVLRAEIEKPVSTLNEQYVGRLEGVKKELQERGSLEGLLLVDQEIEAVRSSGQVPAVSAESDLKELVAARNIYHRTRERIEAQLAPHLKANDGEYAKELETVMKAMTRQGRLDEALLVQKEVESVASRHRQSRPVSREGSVDLKMQVDGISHLFVKGDSLWYDHTLGKAARPGLHFGNFPTYINRETEWMPEWDSLVTLPFDAGIGLPGDEPAPEVSIRVSNGRGWAEIIQQPTAANDYTLKVEVRDVTRQGRGFNGSDWLEFRLSW